MYLHQPRLNFTGRFFTNVSTINNSIENYSSNGDIKRDWNPNGLARFRVTNAKVTSLGWQGGQTQIVNQAVKSVELGTFSGGKLVDLDVENQTLSEVIGVHLEVGDGARGFKGVLRPCTLQDLWRRSNDGQGKAGGRHMSGIFVSVLDDVEWFGENQDGFLKVLHGKTSKKSMLAIRFVLENYYFDEATPDDPRQGYGRIVGTIGPFTEGQPAQFLTRRLALPPKPAMDPEAAAPHAPITHENLEASVTGGEIAELAVTVQAGGLFLDVDNRRISVDLANSFSNRQGSIGEPAPFHALRLVLADGTALGKEFTYGTKQNLVEGGIIDVALTHEMVLRAKMEPVHLQMKEKSDSQWETVLQEEQNGRYANVERFTMRVVAGEAQQLVVRAFTFGGPLVGEKLTMVGGVPRDSKSKPEKLDIADSGTSRTDATGRARFSIATKAKLTLDPARTNLDSILYEIKGNWQGWNRVSIPVLPQAALLLWAPYARANVDKPTWEQDVKPIFDLYMKIYPGMKKLLDLTNRGIVETRRAGIIERMSLPYDNGAYMPVTRDLSPQKIKVILKYLGGLKSDAPAE